MGERFVPARYQPPLPLDRLILKDGAEGAGDRMELDVLIVGAGPAGLACAIELARLAQRAGTDLNIGVLEKAEALGEHSLSGAVVNPRAFRELFPDLKDADFPFRAPVVKEAVYLLTAKGKWRLPTPPSMRNHGNYVASLCEIVRWHGAQRSCRQSHGAQRGDEGLADAGVVRMARRAVGEPADLCPRREGAVGDEAAARSRDPHAGVAAAEGRVRRQLRVSPRAESGRAGSRGGARLQRRGARRARPVAAVQATSLAARAARRWRNDRVGCEDDP